MPIIYIIYRYDIKNIHVLDDSTDRCIFCIPHVFPDCVWIESCSLSMPAAVIWGCRRSCCSSTTRRWVREWRKQPIGYRDTDGCAKIGSIFLISERERERETEHARFIKTKKVYWPYKFQFEPCWLYRSDDIQAVLGDKAWLKGNFTVNTMVSWWLRYLF